MIYDLHILRYVYSILRYGLNEYRACCKYPVGVQQWCVNHQPIYAIQCDKIKKRRSSLFGTFHLANSSALEKAGMKIEKSV